MEIFEYLHIKLQTSIWNGPEVGLFQMMIMIMIFIQSLKLPSYLKMRMINCDKMLSNEEGELIVSLKVCSVISLEVFRHN